MRINQSSKKEKKNLPYEVQFPATCPTHQSYEIEIQSKLIIQMLPPD